MSAHKDKASDKTRALFVGNVQVGGGAPVSVQSMCTEPTTEPERVLSQIKGLEELGCELVRVAIPHSKALDGFEQICAASVIPVIADIHFDYRLAIEASKRGAKALRINPGNIGSMDKVDAVIEAAAQANIPIRIGVNAGSLDPYYREKGGWSLPDKLVASSQAFVEHFEKRGYEDIALSAKAHDVNTTVETYQRLSRELPHIPLHIGVTEAGTLRQGTVKSALGLGLLLSQGIGDTMRVSLTADPKEEVKVAWDILASLSLRRRSPEIISCPTCGRCQVDLVSLANEVTEHLSTLKADLSVAVMGCAVNGPGEAKDADLGVACGKGMGILFSKGEMIKKVPEEEILSALYAEIEKRTIS